MENNNQKLRDAVKSLLDFLYNIGIDEETASISHKDPALRELLHTDRTLKVLRKAKAALADPPRNCDRRGIKNHTDAVRAFCHEQSVKAFKIKPAKEWCLQYSRWLFAKAEGGAK